ncbi:hypothetical protein Scep_004029 [Stephania cephalantha]|uniref:Uncharacterized protein n=1 Tax=Stephania cephalantha TaxID=152367 RepID=A0AAP0KU72_9MAGN
MQGGYAQEERRAPVRQRHGQATVADGFPDDAPAAVLMDSDDADQQRSVRRQRQRRTNATRRGSPTPPTRTDEGEDNAGVDNSEFRRNSDVSDGGLDAKKMSSNLKFVRKEWIYARVKLLNEIWSLKNSIEGYDMQE